MSYILEALQKSEHTRQRGKVPDLSTIPATTARAHRDAPSSRQPYILAGFAVTLLAAVLGWWRPWQVPAQPELEKEPAPTHSTTAPEARDAQPLAAIAPAQQPPAGDRQAASGTPAQPMLPHPAAALSPQPSRSAELVAARSAPAAPANVPTQPAETPPVRRATVAPAPLADKAAAPSTSVPKTTAPAASRATDAGGEAVKASSAPTPSPHASTGRILSLQELPPSVRNSLPRLTVSGYASAGDSGKRMVVVNDRLVQEGDEASPGVTVVAVTGDGVVFDFQGYRFRPQP